MEEMLKNIMADQAQLAADARNNQLAIQNLEKQFGVYPGMLNVKEVVVNKRRLTEYETVALTKECSSRIQNKLPTKLKDSGASINLMPTSLYKKLGLGSPKPTTIILELADRSVARPEGVVEDVLVQVGSLIFPVDFVVLNFEPDHEVPFILGRPFLATGWAMIDVAAAQLTMRSHDKVEVFDVYKALKLPVVYEELSSITAIHLEAEARYIASKDPLERVLGGAEIYGDAEAQEMVQFLDVALVGTFRDLWEPLNRVLGPPPKPFIQVASQLELKALPAHLMYAFLGENKTLLVILFATLSDAQVEATLIILKKRKIALGWKMSDIHGISPALCMHKIYMEEGHKSSAQH
ncbi:uncharacterized protein [Solanum tuberosum]|uniref:uncharacterized protein n=1 Tax=Solanum tuberosum TaxID=4113 RepID=UPI00073A0CF3|nr:PREDICTED: uncharacterized protein LOC107060060 [Solanum tuberosum]